MNKILKLLFFIFIIAVNNTLVLSKENFFEKAMQMYESEKYEDAKFLFERNIVYNPKDAKTYLYLAKIYNIEEDQTKEEKNLESTLLIEPDNEEAMYMLIDVKLKKSDFEQVKKLRNDFEVICKTLCSKLKSIDERLINIEAKNES